MLIKSYVIRIQIQIFFDPNGRFCQEGVTSQQEIGRSTKGDWFVSNMIETYSTNSMLMLYIMMYIYVYVQMIFCILYNKWGINEGGTILCLLIAYWLPIDCLFLPSLQHAKVACFTMFLSQAPLIVGHGIGSSRTVLPRPVFLDLGCDSNSNSTSNGDSNSNIYVSPSNRQSI